MMQMVPNPGRAELPSHAPTPRRKTASGLSADVKRLRQEELTRRCHPPPSRPHAHLHRTKHLVIVVSALTNTIIVSTSTEFPADSPSGTDQHGAAPQVCAALGLQRDGRAVRRKEPHKQRVDDV